MAASLHGIDLTGQLEDVESIDADSSLDPTDEMKSAIDQSKQQALERIRMRLSNG